MDQDLTAVLGASTGALLVMGYAAWSKVRDLKAVVENAEAAASGSELARTQLARQAAGIRSRLSTYAETETNLLAEAVAEQYLADTFGITRDRMTRLARRF